MMSFAIHRFSSAIRVGYVAFAMFALISFAPAAYAASQEPAPAPEPATEETAEKHKESGETHVATATLAEPAHAAEEKGANKAAAESGGEVFAQPNRPSLSDSPEVLPAGQAQLEYGWTRSRLDADHNENELSSMLRIGVARNLELRWGWDNFVRESDPLSTHSGTGDTTVGMQYQFMHQSGASPDLAFSYSAKLPTASASLHFSGEVDHTFAFLAGKHFGKNVFDVNTVYRLVGRDGAPGTDANGILIVTVARPLGDSPVTLIGEVLGESRLNAKHGAFATTLVAVSFEVAPRFVIDVGMEFGFTPHAPDRHLLVGFTYAFGNPRSSSGGHHPAPGH